MPRPDQLLALETETKLLGELLDETAPAWNGFGYLGWPRPVPLSPEQIRREQDLRRREIEQSARDLGLVICTCTGVDRGGDPDQHIVLRNPSCPVHKQFDRLESK